MAWTDPVTRDPGYKVTSVDWNHVQANLAILKTVISDDGGYLKFGANHSTVTDGTIFKSAANGLSIFGVAGSANDFILATPSGGTGIMRVPTGTPNAIFGGYLQGSAQPGFLAYVSASTLTLSDGQTIVCDTEVYDEPPGSYAGGEFTALVTGRYLFTVCASWQQCSASTDRTLFMQTSNSTYLIGRQQHVAIGDELIQSGSVIADMDIGDTAHVVIGIGSGTATFVGGGGTYGTYWSARLLP